MSRLFSVIYLIVCYGYTTVKTNCDLHKNLIERGHILLTELIPCEYKKELLPPNLSESSPSEVEVSLVIKDVNSINAADMDFRVDMILQMSWSDSRLNLSAIKNLSNQYVAFPHNIIENFWTPDPYIANSKISGITSLTTMYSSLTLYINHTLKYSARLYTVVGCQMDFHQYPMDIQNCSIILKSFKYEPEELKLVWRNWSSIEIFSGLQLLQFELTKPLRHFITDEDEDDRGNTNKHRMALVVEFEFRRMVMHHFVQTFVPSFLLVALSWFSFWMGLDAIPGRVSLVMTSLLTLTTLFKADNNVPPVAYIKLIDVWTFGCLVFIFASLGEFALIKVIRDIPRGQWIPPMGFHRFNSSIHPKLSSVEKSEDGTTSINVIPVFQTPSGSNRIVVPKNSKENNSPEATNQNMYNSTIGSLRGTSSNQVWDPEYGVTQLPNSTSNGGISTRSRCASPPPQPETSSTQDVDVEGFDYFKFSKKKQKRSWRESLRRFSFNLHWKDDKTGERKILWEEIDKVCRLLFPILFLIFMIIYFSIMYTRSF